MLKYKLITICDDLKLLKFARTMPYVFTEFGVAMLFSVLKSQRAVQVNIQIIKARSRVAIWGGKNENNCIG